jgi:tetratricopeptide (TPR) repeat protein
LALSAGSHVGPYEIIALLGAGGMGEVYRARDSRLERDVAIKVLPAQLTDTAQARERFQREARAIAALQHPNICTVHDVGETGEGHAFLVMELLVGETLQRRLTRGPLDESIAVDLAAALADGLDAAHRAGVVHRDVKPANIFLTAHGPKILDFGLAKTASREASAASMQPTMTAAGPLTDQGSTVGTVAYMSPEQLRAEDVDARTDLFALGLVLYEMTTGCPAFSGATSAVIAAAILHEQPRPPRQIRPDLSVRLEEIIAKAIEKDGNLRYQHASDLRADLRRAQRDMGSPRPVAVAPAPPVPRRTRWWLAPAAVVVAVAIVALSFRSHRPPGLTDKDTIVLADFTNTTGDPVFDGTLRQGLAIQLEQSPFLKIMDDEQVQRVFRLMSLPRGARITNPIAHEICVREGAAATIDGTIATLGKDYVITLQAIACHDGATLAREQTPAPDKEHVLSALGSAATAMRGKLGESRSLIQKLDRPLEQATTPSLEALQAYTAGRNELGKGNVLAAVPLLERAIALDSNFALAHFFLGAAFNTAGDAGRNREYYEKAFALIDRVSEFERVTITAGYYDTYGELDKEIDTYQLAIRTYPRVGGFHNQLGIIYVDLGQYEEGLKEGQESVRLEPNVEPPYRRQLDAYMCLDRLREAEELAQKVRALGIDGGRIHQRFLEMAYIEGDQTAIARETQWFAGKPVEYLSFGLQAAWRNVHGQRRESSKLYQRAAETARRQGLQNAAAEFEDAAARSDALSGNCGTAHHLGRPAIALALCGDSAGAEKLAAETTKFYPNGTIWNAVQLPEIRAAIALNRDQPAKSVELLASASPYERSYLEAVYLRGLAYLRLHKGADAAAEFQKIVDHKGANWGATWIHPYWGQYYSLSYLGMARASALAGDAAKARKAFQDFFDLWKDADPDVPILQQAKAEYAQLQ